MEKKTSNKSLRPSIGPSVDIKASASGVKASHPSSNPINEGLAHNPFHSHFEVAVHTAFFKIFDI